MNENKKYMDIYGYRIGKLEIYPILQQNQNSIWFED